MYFLPYFSEMFYLPVSYLKTTIYLLYCIDLKLGLSFEGGWGRKFW
jgi:hypothetical protein